MSANRDKCYEDSLIEDLKDPAEAAAYLDATLELNDQGALLVALRQVARAHGMAEVARKAELGEKSLFKSLAEDGNPTLSTLTKLLHAMGLRLTVTPEHA